MNWIGAFLLKYLWTNSKISQYLFLTLGDNVVEPFVTWTSKFELVFSFVLESREKRARHFFPKRCGHQFCVYFWEFLQIAWLFESSNVQVFWIYQKSENIVKMVNYWFAIKIWNIGKIRVSHYFTFFTCKIF